MFERQIVVRASFKFKVKTVSGYILSVQPLSVVIFTSIPIRAI